MTNTSQEHYNELISAELDYFARQEHCQKAGGICLAGAGLAATAEQFQAWAAAPAELVQATHYGFIAATIAGVVVPSMVMGKNWLAIRRTRAEIKELEQPLSAK